MAENGSYGSYARPRTSPGRSWSWTATSWPPDGLEGTSWLAEDIDGAAVVDRVQATLIFDAGQKVAGRAACNRYFGTYRQAGDTLISRLSAEAH
jgi:heat shock protein HslJ